MLTSGSENRNNCFKIYSFGANIDKSSSFGFKMDNSSCLRNRKSCMGKETLPGDYSYLRVSTSGKMIPEVFPRKICPLRTSWKSRLLRLVNARSLVGPKMLASESELKIESYHRVQQIQVSAEVVHLIAIVGF